MDIENKAADLSGYRYFSTQNTSIECWAMFEKAKKGCLEVIFISELKQQETLDGSGLQIEQRTGKELDCR